MIREYKIKIDDAILQGHTPAEFREPTGDDQKVMSFDGEILCGGLIAHRGPRLILSPPKPEPKFEPGTYWVNDGDLYVCITEGEWYAPAPAKHMAGTGPYFKDAAGSRWFNLDNPKPWLPQPGERVADKLGNLGRFNMLTGDARRYVLWDKSGVTPTEIPDNLDLIPADFAPKPAPAPDPRESLALAIREALPKLETLCDLARRALTPVPSASAILAVLDADQRKKFGYISANGVAAYLDLKSRAAVERKAASL